MYCFHPFISIFTFQAIESEKKNTHKAAPSSHHRRRRETINGSSSLSSSSTSQSQHRVNRKSLTRIVQRLR
ncbi:hypothetical protein AKJ16_DCAP20639 [Drosera capensis]